jgi:ATPase subunit of ABC transporter with duplicated ATPase domains
MLSVSLFKKEIMLLVQSVSYTHPNKNLLFADLSFALGRQDKIALIGNNGTGKSTLLQLLSGSLEPTGGIITASAAPYYVPQLLGQFDEMSLAAALRIGDKLNALKEILAGNGTEASFTTLDDDWTIEERCREAFSRWQLHGLDLMQPMGTLSGGQKTKVFLAGIDIHQPEIVLLDEPSNHLDAAGRELLYRYITTTVSTLVVVSHDRTLLNLLDTVYELSQQGIAVYGGNYDFYLSQKQIENEALQQDMKSKEKALRKARETAREAMERQQKLDARGKKKQEKAGVPTIAMNTLRNNAEKSTARMQEVHSEKTANLAQELLQLRKTLPDSETMKMRLDHSALHKGKTLVTARRINLSYDTVPLWAKPLDFTICSGDRVAVKGRNGSGKTSLVRMILGALRPTSGTLDKTDMKVIYIDQDYSLICPEYSVYEQAQQFNPGMLLEHEVKIRLNRFLFTQQHWEKPCKALSGGEKMRLLLCCLTLYSQAPDMIVLDEPTNNLDIQNLELLTAALNDYQGTLIVISHDDYFLKQIAAGREIILD